MNKTNEMNRRGFLKTTAVAGVALAVPSYGNLQAANVAADKNISNKNMERSISEGVGYQMTPEQRHKLLVHLNEQRWKDAEAGKPAAGYHEIVWDDKGNIVEGNRLLPETLPDNPHPILADFFDYYRTPRGYHAHSINSNTAWNATVPLSFLNFPLQNHIKEIAPRPMLLIAGEKAHSRYMSEDAYKAANNPNAQLLIVPGATHCDLYDGGKEHNKIPFDEIEVFFKENL